MSLACAHRVPLIAADVGKIGNSVKKMRIGLVFDAESSLSLKSAINKFVNLNTEEVREIKENLNIYVQ